MARAGAKRAAAKARKLALTAAAARFSLDRLDVAKYEIFAVSSGLFWRQQRPLISSFFEHLASIGSRGFLAANDARVCEGAVEQLGVACVVSRRYVRDGSLSKERWHIMRGVLRRNHRIAYAGLDVRFLRPVRAWFDATSGADAAFEGAYSALTRKLSDFTPDFVLAYPTANAIWLIDRLAGV